MTSSSRASARRDARRVAMFRAVNVGGTGRLTMADLRAAAEAERCTRVETLGASGNLVYAPPRGRSSAGDAERLAARVSALVGRKTPAVVRTAADLARLVAADPFERASVPDKWRYVVFLTAPSRHPLPALAEDDPLAWGVRRPREVCYTMREPNRVAIDIVKRIERDLEVAATARNWNVVRKLAALARA